MREIKFRAWAKWLGKMIQPNDGDFIAWYAMKNWKECLEVMQFTGLRDKNGKEIYEGDYVEGFLSFEGGRLITAGEIIWNDEFAGFALKNEGGETLLHNHFRDSFVVLGNIYENPELLK